MAVAGLFNVNEFVSFCCLALYEHEGENKKEHLLSWGKQKKGSMGEQDERYR
jgi:hypothetical protein